MLRSNRRKGHTDTHVEEGPSLARLPTHLVGSVLTVAGLALLLKNGATPNDQFPDGTVSGDKFLGFETNGWTAFFTIAAGAALLFGAAQHLAARTMALIVGLALGACSAIALYDGDDVLGLAAANGPTKLGWGIAAAVLLIIALLPRTRRQRHDDVRTEAVRTDEPSRTRRFGRDTRRVDSTPSEGRTEGVAPTGSEAGRSEVAGERDRTTAATHPSTPADRTDPRGT